MLLCHFKFSFKEDKLNFRFIGTLSRDQDGQGLLNIVEMHDRISVGMATYIIPVTVNL